MHVVIHGPPQAARRHRVAVRGGHARAYHDAAHTHAEAGIADALRSELPEGWSTDGPIQVIIHAYFGRPARLKRRKDAGDQRRAYTGKPDGDNIAKLVMDAATKAGIWRDDGQVAALSVRKWYLDLNHDGGEVGLPRIEVTISPLDG